MLVNGNEGEGRKEVIFNVIGDFKKKRLECVGGGKKNIKFIF